jgi:outer membrane protein assembly factor BamD
MIKKLIVVAAIAVLAGCASDDANKTAIQNFNDANYYFTKAKWDGAEKLYQKILDNAPDSPYRIHSLLGVADSYYMQGDFISSAPMYARYVELYPMDERTPHALFYEGMSYYHDMVPVKKDQTSTEKALVKFTRFVEKYPDHPATPFAKEKILFLTDRLAEKIYTIAEYYYNITGYGSCIGRVDELLKKYPDTRFKGDALMLKARSYAGEESYEKAKIAFLQIAFEFKGTKHGAQAEAELKALDQK